MQRKKYFHLFLWAAFFLVSGCKHPLEKLSAVEHAYEVTYNPYENVVWGEWRACLSQHHDHLNGDEQRIRDYDRAGYNAIVSMHYGGVKSQRHTRRERLWPAYRFLRGYKNDAAFLQTAENLKFFIPGMEEVGYHHMTSAFLTRYIEKWEKHIDRVKSPWQYTSTQNCLDLIEAYGGAPIVAHPENRLQFYLRLEDIQHIEIYNAFYRYHYEIGKFSADKNEHFVQVWDQLLARRSPKIWGYAVNDWHGPFRKDIEKTHPKIYDSGKTLVMISEWNLESYRASLEQGAFFSIVDRGVEKNKYPRISRIFVSENEIDLEIDDGTVTWQFCGVEIRQGNVLDLTKLPRGLSYIRAEVSNAFGTVYVQPFSLRVN